MLPFAVALAAGFAALPLPARDRHTVSVLAAAVLAALVAVAALTAPWSRLPSGAQAAPPLALLGVIALLDHGTGGRFASTGPLVAVPIMWLALYGTNRQLGVGLAGLALVFVVPIVALGPPDYPDPEWRRALLWVAIAPPIALTIQRLVQRLRAAERRLRADADDIAALVEATRELARSAGIERVRPAICSAAVKVAGAHAAVLWEPTPDGSGLVITAAVGADTEGMMIPFDGEESVTGRAFRSGELQFVGDIPSAEGVSHEMARRAGTQSGIAQPILYEGEAVGVLGVGWAEPTHRLAPRVAELTRVLADEAAVAFERARMVQRLEDAARTDDLTGLPNRRAWQHEVVRELARARREERPLCVAMLDLDHFKRFNDERGHQAGDRFLREVASAWQTQLRGTDLLVRYGGEEFVLLLPACTPEGALATVERLRAAVPNDETCSVGLIRSDGADAPEALLARVDKALYEAKRAGRDRVVVAG